MRAIGLGSCSGMARVGAIVTPFVAQVRFGWKLTRVKNLENIIQELKDRKTSFLVCLFL